MEFAGWALADLAVIFAAGAGVITLLYLLRMRRRQVIVPFAELWEQVTRESETRKLWRKLRRLFSWLVQLFLLALVCLALGRAQRLARVSAAITAMVSEALVGNPAHFDARIFSAKPHPGQATYARWVREDLEYQPGPSFEGRIQDRYSVRCSPHVVGVLVDAIPWMWRWTETELNGANDNPLIDPDSGEALHGGNFYGGHACFVADGLKNLVANLADLHDRQLALLCSGSSNNGLPENLNGREGPDSAAHHGFKAMQIAASALAAEALKNTMPASVFSRSTECHNQDKVSMGTIAAREALRVVELSEQVAAILLLAGAQAVDLRLRAGGSCHPRSLALRDAVRERAPFVSGDRRQDGDIAAMLTMLRGNELPEHILTDLSELAES